jgi:D-alanyl-D-alanine carboxypeptidase
LTPRSHKQHARGTPYEARIRAAFGELSIPFELVRRRALPLCREARTLVVVEVDARGREQRLTPAASVAGKKMKAAAAEAKVGLYLISAFRSFDRQCELLRAKLAGGQRLDEILTVSAPPGYSEHHTGRAIDIGASPDDPLEEAFERTDAYAWLMDNASRYGYALSYPRDNRYGYRYEPWHWMHGHAARQPGRRRGVS